MSGNILLQSTSLFWKRIGESLQHQQQHLDFLNCNINGFFVFLIIANFEIFLLLFISFSTFISCCKKKNSHHHQMHTDQKNTNPQSGDVTEDLIAGVPANAVNLNTPVTNNAATPAGTPANGTTTAAADGKSRGSQQPEKSKTAGTKIEKSKTNKSELKTAKEMPKNIWDLAYPTKTTETVETGDGKE